LVHGRSAGLEQHFGGRGVGCGWSRGSIVAGQRELERLRREVDAAFAALVIADGGDDRDAAARIARATNVSTGCARERVRVARVCDAIPAAHMALGVGDVSVEHVSLLFPVLDDPDAASLVEVAAGQSPGKFRRTVARHQLDRNPADVGTKQKASRSLTFFDSALPSVMCCDSLRTGRTRE
jgi:hypothetical protein